MNLKEKIMKNGTDGKEIKNDVDPEKVAQELDNITGRPRILRRILDGYKTLAAIILLPLFLVFYVIPGYHNYVARDAAEAKKTAEQFVKENEWVIAKVEPVSNGYNLTLHRECVGDEFNRWDKDKCLINITPGDKPVHIAGNERAATLLKVFANQTLMVETRYKVDATSRFSIWTYPADHMTISLPDGDVYEALNRYWLVLEANARLKDPYGIRTTFKEQENISLQETLKTISFLKSEKAANKELTELLPEKETLIFNKYIVRVRDDQCFMFEKSTEMTAETVSVYPIGQCVVVGKKALAQRRDSSIKALPAEEVKEMSALKAILKPSK